jgi:hypothetical protein
MKSFDELLFEAMDDTVRLVFGEAAWFREGTDHPSHQHQMFMSQAATRIQGSREVFFSS